MPCHVQTLPATLRLKEMCLLCWAQVTWSPSLSYQNQLRAFWSFWQQPSSSLGSHSRRTCDRLILLPRWCDMKINESGTLVQDELDSKALWMLIHFVHPAMGWSWKNPFLCENDRLFHIVALLRFCCQLVVTWEEETSNEGLLDQMGLSMSVGHCVDYWLI